MNSSEKRAVFCAVLLMASAAFGQSLGDVAREQRQKEQAKNGQTPPKVITNEDLGEPPEGTPENAKTQGKADNPKVKPLGSKTAEQWKAEIEAQKTAIANLQKRIDQVNASVHFARASATWREVQHNERQEQKLDEVQNMQDQLAQEQQKLEGMQESARREGFGSSVYDPN
jgi:hypothetical protein